VCPLGVNTFPMSCFDVLPADPARQFTFVSQGSTDFLWYPNHRSADSVEIYPDSSGTFDMGDWTPKITESYRDAAGGTHLLYLWQIAETIAFNHSCLIP
jgi:hypothetical protein